MANSWPVSGLSTKSCSSLVDGSSLLCPASSAFSERGSITGLLSPDGKQLAAVGRFAGPISGEVATSGMWLSGKCRSSRLPWTGPDTFYGVSWAPDASMVALRLLRINTGFAGIDPVTGKQNAANGARHSDWILGNRIQPGTVNTSSAISREYMNDGSSPKWPRSGFIDNVTSITPGALKRRPDGCGDSPPKTGQSGFQEASRRHARRFRRKIYDDEILSGRLGRRAPALLQDAPRKRKDGKLADECEQDQGFCCSAGGEYPQLAFNSTGSRFAGVKQSRWQG